MGPFQLEVPQPCLSWRSPICLRPRLRLGFTRLPLGFTRLPLGFTMLLGSVALASLPSRLSRKG